MNDFLGSNYLKKETALAEDLYVKHGKELMSQFQLSELLNQYGKAILKSGEEMRNLGVSQTCSSCAREKTGGCCFEGVEEWYDSVLLLINLLLGTEIPRSRAFKGCCFFVGEHGCRLAARFSFCINYLCTEIRELLGTKSASRLLSISGEEIYLGWEIEKYLRTRLFS